MVDKAGAALCVCQLSLSLHRYNLVRERFLRFREVVPHFGSYDSAGRYRVFGHVFNFVGYLDFWGSDDSNCGVFHNQHPDRVVDDFHRKASNYPEQEIEFEKRGGSS
jgi:hypothetical protein